MHWSEQTPSSNNTRGLIIFFSAKDGEALCSQTLELGKATRPFRYDLNQICFVYTVEVTNRFKGLQLKLLIAKFRLKLKKVGKNIRPFRYDLNKILYNYTVEVTNRFKGLDLIECLKNYGQMFATFYRRR